MPSTQTIIISVTLVVVIAGLGVGLGVGLSGGDDVEVTTNVPVTTNMPDPKVTTNMPDPKVPDIPTPEPVTKTEKFTLQNQIDGKFNGKSVSPDWVPSGYGENWSDYYFSVNSDNKDVEVFDYKTMKKASTFATNTKRGNDEWFRFTVSNNAKWAFFGFDRKKLWRSVSYNATYELYSVDSQSYVSSIFDDSRFESTEYCMGGKSEIQYLRWAPNDIAGVFICGFNIFYFTNPTDFSTLSKVTSDGLDNQVYNGLPDWVYEEEQLGTNNAIWFSPGGKNFMYVKITTQTYFADVPADKYNDHIYKYSWYGDDQYPKTLDISFSKAGTNVMKNYVSIFNTETKSSFDFVKENENIQPYSDQENYFARCDWQGDDKIIILWMTRLQNESKAKLFKSNNGVWEGTDGGKAATYFEPNAWVGSGGPWWPKFNTNSDSYFTLRSRKLNSSELKAKNHYRNNAKVEDDNLQEGFFTVARIDYNSDKVQYLSKHDGNYIDTDLVEYDSGSDILFYRAATPEPKHRQILWIPNASKISTESGDAESSGIWFTQPLFEKYPDRCGWIDMSIHDDWVILNCKGGKDLPVTFGTTLKDILATGGEPNFKLIESNSELANSINNVQIPIREYGAFKSDKYEKPYNYMLFKPYNFDENKTYSLVIETYAGPEFQKVQDRWSPDFCQSMVSEYDIICASVDGRGSGYEGDNFMHMVYKKLGQMEPVDQTDFAIYLSKMKFIDASKIALWGWSYGGYTTTHTISYNNGGNGAVFKCGVAVAPLASWRYYDILYSEKYLANPNDEVEAYDKAEVWYRAEENNYQGFKDTWYTLISGTADDNVHFMSPAHIEKKLVSADVDFDNFFYADEDHSINSSPSVKYHVYQNIRRHLLNKKCLNEL